MIYRTGLRYAVPASSPQQSRKNTTQNAFGGAALACIALACAWTLFSKAIGPGADPVMASANLAPALSSQQPSFAERFEPVASGTSVVAKTKRAYVALLDPTYSLHAAPETFSSEPRPKFERRLVALAPAADDPETQPLPLPVAVAPPAVQLTQTVPLPAPRPSTLRMVAAREVEKAKQAIMSVATNEKPSIFERLFGKPNSGPALAFASADIGDIALPGLSKAANPMGSGMYDRSTAVYDISARTVYLPDGRKLEAHSGLGAKLDDPRYVHVRMQGATPPHLYDLEPREALFHGVPALRLKPVGGEQAIFGRSGLLAHTYMLGPNGDSNGCVSFRDYYAFLNAYRSGTIKRLAVVAKVE
jgi:Protein of unknown function (DUF2778)